MTDFWVSSGYQLLDRDSGGRLTVTPEFLKAYLARPEVVPPAEACAAERQLHARLMSDPVAHVSQEEIAALDDPDAQENWRALLGFRDHLLAHGTLEAAYLALMRRGVGATPPLFVNQLVHVILRNMLSDVDDPFELRAAELFFRTQRLTRHEGTILLADEEIVDGERQSLHASPLTAMFGEAFARGLDVITEDNAPAYFERSDAFDMVLDFRPTGPGRAGLARVMERWLRHMLGLATVIEPLERVTDEDWRWFIGLDVEGTRIGNALWKGEEAGDASERVAALYRLELRDTAVGRSAPIYLIMGMTQDRIVRMKPQNLLLGMPNMAANGHEQGVA